MRLETSDPWRPKLKTWLDKYWDIRTGSMLEALGIPPDKQTRDHGRRLAALMRTFPGWVPSTNVRGKDGKRYRGYIYRDEDWQSRKLKRNFGERCVMITPLRRRRKSMACR